MNGALKCTCFHEIFHTYGCSHVFCFLVGRFMYSPDTGAPYPFGWSAYAMSSATANTLTYNIDHYDGIDPDAWS